eukprot:6326186-Alexandrium_andersonii.AAC.1
MAMRGPHPQNINVAPSRATSKRALYLVRICFYTTTWRRPKSLYRSVLARSTAPVWKAVLRGPQWASLE